MGRGSPIWRSLWLWSPASLLVGPTRPPLPLVVMVRHLRGSRNRGFPRKATGLPLQREVLLRNAILLYPSGSERCAVHSLAR